MLGRALVAGTVAQHMCVKKASQPYISWCQSSTQKHVASSYCHFVAVGALAKIARHPKRSFSDHTLRTCFKHIRHDMREASQT